MAVDQSDSISEFTGALEVVGPRLRELRHRRDFTLDEVAELTGISISTLSRVESGGRRPTLDLLLPLSRLYDITLDELVRLPGGDPRVQARASQRHGVTHIALSRRSDDLVAVKSIYPGRPGNCPVRQTTHPGYDWLYVLSGRLRLAIGDLEHILEPGEAAEFETHLPHGFASASADATEVLHLMSPHGRRVHLRDL